MTPEEINKAGEIILLLILGSALVIGLASMAFGKLVGDSDDAEPVAVTSSAVSSVALQSRPSYTDGRTDGRTDNTDGEKDDITGEKRAALIKLCRMYRASGMSREKARAELKPLGFSLPNAIWTEAGEAEAEQEQQVHTTPVVGRPTDAKFHPVRYQPKYLDPDELPPTMQELEEAKQREHGSAPRAVAME